MMTDFAEPSLLEGSASIDGVVLYHDDPVAHHEAQSVEAGTCDNLAFEHYEGAHDAISQSVSSCEGMSGIYLPHTSENEIHALQAAYPDQSTNYVASVNSNQAQYGQVDQISWPQANMPSASPATMVEFFQLMSQPEHVQAYMQFLQTQQEQQPQAAFSAPPPRARSNSQPHTPTLPVAFASRPQSTDSGFDSTIRERKIAKYRTKRARRLTSSQNSSSESSATTAVPSPNSGTDADPFMPAPKVQKTLTHDLEHRLINSEEEVKMLRSALESREAELHMLRQVIFEEQQYQQWAMHNYGETSSNASSSTATSPRPHSPSMVSSPSNMSLGSSAMDMDFASLDTSSMGSEHHMMDVMAQNQRRQEKLKRLGGPPSDVYHPWWNGISLNHPAFQQKEDWQSFELRPQERLAQERLNYFVMMQRHRMEQSRAEMGEQTPQTPNEEVNSSEPPSPDHSQSAQTPVSHPYTHQQTAFYQSPHQSHIITGSPVQGAGYWSGHFAPANAEKIDFSKISLRKTSSNMPPNFAHPQGQQQHPHLQASPTAAIWREAMAHPEIHHFPSQLGWMQEQPELMARAQAAMSRTPFRRLPPNSSVSHATAHSPMQQ